MTTKNATFSTSKIVVLAMALMLAVTTASYAQSANSSTGLSGTWRVTVSLQVCATGAPIGAGPFQSILSFHQGGTMSGTTSNPGFQPGQRSSDYGVWSYQGNQTYDATSEAYILYTAGPFVRGTQRIAQTITVNGDTFTSNATVQFFDVNHNQVTAACAVATGTRFE